MTVIDVMTHNHKRNKRDIVQETIELINNYNAGKERCVILTRNFNEIEDRHTRGTKGGGLCERG